jgi:hypothetical protein
MLAACCLLPMLQLLHILAACNVSGIDCEASRVTGQGEVHAKLVERWEGRECPFLTEMQIQSICAAAMSSPSNTSAALSCIEYALLNGNAFSPDCDSCLNKLFPCSQTVVGNLMLMVAYGFILSCGAKLISDGAEMLLEVSNPVIVGGLVLPILGALPDAAMILVSGLGPDAQQQLSVGVGTLAGSTIMLLTIPWLGGLLIGRCDIGSSGDAVDKKCSKFDWFSQVEL